MTFSLILASLLYGSGHYLITGQIDVYGLTKYTVSLIVGSSIFLVLNML